MMENNDGSRDAAVLELRERLAEARHNEKLGWGAVLTSAILVMTLSPAAQVVSSAAESTGGGTMVVVTPFNTGVIQLDMVTGLSVLSATLVLLGVSVAVYCRFLRSRVYAQLRSTLEAHD